MRKFYIFFLFLILAMPFSLSAQPRFPAPELDGGKAWLNIDKPLSIKGLKGKIILLDFWTYGCVNCIHVIPDLKRLEEKYQKELVVIGVHSAKFENEKNTENIRNIILRYGIEHPVVNDADFKIWESYGINAWPSMALIDPDGYFVGKVSGEGNYNLLDLNIKKLADEFRSKGKLNEVPLKLALEKAKVGSLPLSYPGKVLADEKSGRLFISDSNHNRIVITKLDGTLIDTIGNGRPALLNGNFAAASFKNPQGLALDGDNLYIADTGNHAIRKIDLKSKIVTTAAGTGEQSARDSDGGEAGKTALSSPWDIFKMGDTIYIAMAGNHQIWKLDLQKNEVRRFFGSGYEARRDGDSEDSAFAQTSGITGDGENLYIADSESNIIRKIDLKAGMIETLAGGDLFEFGDKDGEGDDVRLQHPLGVYYLNGKVLIADTYNHKIKSLDPNTKAVTTLFGSSAGQMDGAKAQFYEPGGLSVAGNKLYIADTNNHAIREIDLILKTTKTLVIKNLIPPMVENTAPDEGFSPNKVEEILPIQEIKAGSEIALKIEVKLPSGYHLNQTAPQSFSAKIMDQGMNLKFKENGLQEIIRKKAEIKLPMEFSLVAAKEGAAEINIKQAIYYCREDNTGVCYLKTLIWKVPVKIGKNGVEIKVSKSL